MPKIIDVIVLKHYGNAHYYLVLDEMPRFLFDKRDYCLSAEDDGFHERYGYEAPGPNWKAFGGAKFEIPLKDGGVEHAIGQWWWCHPKETENTGEIISVGIATVEMLHKCYVFQSGNIEKKKLDAWLAENEPSDNYRKYQRQEGQR